MNIKEAKEEISNTLKIYHEKDEQGEYCYPLIRQRPILLMGPPGIGKTAIMEQVARENNVGLVAYTITHHTRQSAIGLPRICERVFEEEKISVTEYTMSEIIASVYDCMEKTGKKEGILFIDEINCASETLAPTMLQFLQNKTFGSHKVPKGWMIVAAGNPSEYNKSVREFDIVTLDRVRRIDVEVDLDIWMEYAWKQQIHGAVISYLNMKKDRFYQIVNTVDEKSFVTARGWEDLSELIKSYERRKIPVSEKQVFQFLQQEDTAKEFAAYYKLYCKYGQDYGIPDIVDGTISEVQKQEKRDMAENGTFEEKFMVVELFLDDLAGRFRKFSDQKHLIRVLYQSLVYYKNYQPEKNQQESLELFIEEKKKNLKARKTALILTAGEYRICLQEILILEEILLEIKKRHLMNRQEGFPFIREMFEKRTMKLTEAVKELEQQLSRTFTFLEEVYGDGQEMILFVTELSRNEEIMEYISENGCDKYLRYSEKLLFRKREKELQKSCEELLRTE